MIRRIKLSNHQVSIVKSHIVEGSLDATDLECDELILSANVVAHFDGWRDRLDYWSGEKDSEYRRYRRQSESILRAISATVSS